VQDTGRQPQRAPDAPFGCADNAQRISPAAHTTAPVAKGPSRLTAPVWGCPTPARWPPRTRAWLRPEGRCWTSPKGGNRGASRSVRSPPRNYGDLRRACRRRSPKSPFDVPPARQLVTPSTPVSGVLRTARTCALGGHADSCRVLGQSISMRLTNGSIGAYLARGRPPSRQRVRQVWCPQVSDRCSSLTAISRRTLTIGNSAFCSRLMKASVLT